MSLYKITVEKVTDKTDDKYASDVTVYEQIVEGDDSIVNAVVGSFSGRTPACPPSR